MSSQAGPASGQAGFAVKDGASGATALDRLKQPPATKPGVSATPPETRAAMETRVPAAAPRVDMTPEQRKAERLKQKLKQRAQHFSYAAREEMRRGGGDDEWAED